MPKVKITLFKSLITSKAQHRKTIEALGLRRVNSSVIKEVNPAIQGMIDTVSYMVKVEEVK